MTGIEIPWGEEARWCHMEVTEWPATDPATDAPFPDTVRLDRLEIGARFVDRKGYRRTVAGPGAVQGSVTIMSEDDLFCMYDGGALVKRAEVAA